MHNVTMHTVRGTELASAQPSRAMRQAEVVAALAEVLPRASILYRHEDTAPFECDALTAYRTSPMVVVLPESFIVPPFHERVPLNVCVPVRLEPLRAKFETFTPPVTFSVPALARKLPLPVSDAPLAIV